MDNNILQTIIPSKLIKNLNIIINEKLEILNVPLSTYETPLFASVQRGCKLSQKSPIIVECFSDCMTRSIILQTNGIINANKILTSVDQKTTIQELQQIVNTTSSHCKLLDIHCKIIGNLLYLRLKYNTNEASGHNMTTIASNEIGKYLVKKFHNIDENIKYLSNSGNMCTDKKVSAINSISDRGKNVSAEIVISKEDCSEILHSTPEKIIELNINKNLIGSTIAGSLCSSNAHYANMLSAIYLPLGQDIANIIEGSQGITYCKLLENGNLYFSVNIPNIICGTIGNGKDFDFVKANLKTIGCIDKNGNIINNASIRMAKIICAIVLCGELSLMSALTNQDELVNSHKKLERKNKK